MRRVQTSRKRLSATVRSRSHRQNRDPGRNVALRGLLLFLVALSLSTSCERRDTSGQPTGPGDRAKDTPALYQLVLEWAVLNKPLPGQTADLPFPDRNLLQDRQTVRLSQSGLPRGITLSLPDMGVQVLSENELQKQAEQSGRFPALRFGELVVSGDEVELELEMVWFVPKRSRELPLSGGGVTLRLHWQDGAWRVQGLQGLRIS